MRTMLYFGSFNPIHNGHLAIADYVVEQNLCDRLWLVVSPQNPFKESDELAGEQERLEMVNLALDTSHHKNRIQTCDIEFSLPKPSYTIDTLRVLGERYPGERFSLLIGSDNVDGLDRWKESRILLNDYPIFVYPRPGYAPTKFTDRITLLGDAPQMEVSSSAVREGICSGKEVSGWVPAAVLHYIKEHRLWKCHNESKTK